jgi:hypothetical protein
MHVDLQLTIHVDLQLTMHVSLQLTMYVDTAKNASGLKCKGKTFHLDSLIERMNNVKEPATSRIKEMRFEKYN